jgi:hypothetical protein
MFGALFKKKISEEKLINYFVVSTVKMVDDAFADVAEIICADGEFKFQPQIDTNNVDPFLWTVITGNLSYIPRHFNNYQDIRLLEEANRKFAQTLDMPIDEFKAKVKVTHQKFKAINRPSKNTLYAMSKMVFADYGLCQYQDDYFRKMNVPNPILLKHLNELMESFLFNWEEFVDKYKISE